MGKGSQIFIPEGGKIPPQAIEAEEGLLGILMVDFGAMDDIGELISPVMFYKPAHQKLYTAIESLFKRDKFADLVTVMQFLRDRGELEEIGGPVYLMELTSKIVTSHMAIEYALIIKDRFIQRDVIRICSTLTGMAYDGNIDTKELLEAAERELFTLGEVNITRGAESIGVILSKVLEVVQKREAVKAELIGVPSGLLSLDRITLGWQPGDLIILAARPSMGKSAIAIQIAKFAALTGYPTLMFSLEMTDTQLGERILSGETGIDSYDLKRGRNLNWTLLEKSLTELIDKPFWIDDSSKMTIYDFRSRVRKEVKKHGIKLVVCDYLNLFTGDESKENMSEKYGSISKMFKQVAKDCGVAVIALAQLNRNVEGRKDGFPKLSDLRNSGEIEADADIVIFPTRYKALGMYEDTNGRDLTKLARLEVAKNRNGRVDVIEVNVSSDCVKWSDIELTSFESEPEHKAGYIDFTQPQGEAPWL